MPVSLSFTLLYGAPTSGVGMLPAFPSTLGVISGAALACNAVVYDQQHFLDLCDRLLPYDYLAPMKLSENAGYEILQMFSALGARLSSAVGRLECSSFVVFATGGARTIIPVQFSRPTVAGGAVTIKAGTVVKASRHNRRFALLEDVYLSNVALSVNGLVEAEATGWEFNVQGEVVTSSGITLTGEIDSVETYILDPVYGDASITVAQISFPTILGKSADLDGLGANREVARAAGESDDQLRVRVRSLPDVVSPDAIRRGVERRLAPAGIPFDIIEVWEHRYQECYDAPSPNIGTISYQPVPPANPLYDQGVFVYDDPRDPAPFRNRYLDEVEYRGAFFVIVPQDFTILDVGFAYDDPGSGPSDFRDPSTGKQRGTPAYDGASTDPAALVYPACYDGWDFARAAIYAALWSDLQAIKPIGVAAIIETIRP
jgi:hypothetical protein